MDEIAFVRWQRIIRQAMEADRDRSDQLVEQAVGPTPRDGTSSADDRLDTHRD